MSEPFSAANREKIREFAGFGRPGAGASPTLRPTSGQFGSSDIAWNRELTGAKQRSQPSEQECPQSGAADRGRKASLPAAFYGADRRTCRYLRLHTTADLRHAPCGGSSLRQFGSVISRLPVKAAPAAPAPAPAAAPMAAPLPPPAMAPMCC